MQTSYQLLTNESIIKPKGLANDIFNIRVDLVNLSGTGLIVHNVSPTCRWDISRKCEELSYGCASNSAVECHGRDRTGKS